jgi:Divergent InlB B-repeat domain
VRRRNRRRRGQSQAAAIEPKVQANSAGLSQEVLVTLHKTTLTVQRSGTGSGTVTSSPSGIDCGSDCSASFQPDSEVTLTAKAAKGSSFIGWSGSDCSGLSSCTVRLDASETVTANFTRGAPTVAVLAEGTPVKPNTTGFYLNDEVLLEDGSSHGGCLRGGEAKLDDNERSTYSFGFGEVLVAAARAGRGSSPASASAPFRARRHLPARHRQARRRQHGVSCSSTAAVETRLTLGGQGGRYTAQLI